MSFYAAENEANKFKKKKKKAKILFSMFNLA